MSEEINEETIADAVEDTIADAVEDTITDAVEEPVADAIEEPVADAVEEPVVYAVLDDKEAEVKPEEEEEEVEYVCPPEFDEKEEMRKMFVGGLHKETTDEEFKSLFVSFGDVTDFIIIRKDNSKSDRLFGFITFAKCDTLDECLLARPHMYKEKELDVKRAVPRGSDDGTGHFKVKKLHVAGIPETFNPDILKKYIKSRHPTKFGTVDEINILKEKDESGKELDKNRGFGFITVSSEDLADRLTIGETKFVLDGNSMRINKAKPKMGEAGFRGALRGKSPGGRGGSFRGKGFQAGGWGDQGWGAGYGGGGYGGYGAGYGYDYYGYGGYGGGYQSAAPRGRGRYNPY